MPAAENDLPMGHIVVVDRTEYYNGNVLPKHVAQLVKAYLNLLPDTDLVKFIYADAPSDSGRYVSKKDAIAQITSQLENGSFSTGSTQLSTAISSAIRSAANESVSEPICKAVAVVANPSNAQNLNVSTSNAGRVAYFTVIMPTRDTVTSARTDYHEGIRALQRLANDMGGSCIAAAGKGDKESAVYDASGVAGVKVYLDSVRCFKIDLSSQINIDGYSGGSKGFSIDVSAGNHDLGAFSVNVPLSILPTPAPVLTTIPPHTATPKPTATPTPTPTPTPKPTATPTPSPTPLPTIPPEGYRLGDKDGETHPGDFIRQMQTKLRDQDYYEGVQEAYEPGTLDTATLQAIADFCRNMNLKNAREAENGVSDSICKEILELNSESKPRVTPKPSTMDQVKKFLQRPLFAIGSFQVIMWMALALCAVLVVGIIIIVVMMHSGDEGGSSHSAGQPPVSNGNPGVYDPLVTKSDDQPSVNNEKTQPEGVSTLPEMPGLRVNLTIEYQGQVRHESPIITKDYTIGRSPESSLTLDQEDKTVSRHHAELYVENGQLFIRDKKSENNTFVNDKPISDQQDDSDKTKPLKEAPSSGYRLNRGDRIRMGRHYITVNW